MNTHSRKKRKLSHERTEENEVLRFARQLVLEEVDLEIGISRRLEETINSRITWALLLQEALESDRDRPDQPSDAADNYEGAALAALQASEAPILPILSHEAQWDAISRPQLTLAPPTESTPTPTPTPPPSTPIIAYPQRFSSRHNRQRPLPNLAPPPKKHLFLRNTATVPPTIAKLACPDCLRADFPKVQGLLNHCRIRHKREFGSHDECIRQCAVHIPPEEEACVIENGIEQAEVSLPSLRRLFEIAVGGHEPEAEPEESTMGGASNSEGAPGDTEFTRDSEPSEDPLEQPPLNKASASTSTHLSRTLGHHIDTPSLATFLGRAPKRRCVTTHDEDGEVDILEGAQPTHNVKSHWQMSFTHRSLTRPALNAVDDIQRRINGSEDVNGPVSVSLLESLPIQPQLLPDGEGSRFHINARVSVSDRSLWMPLGRRLPDCQDHTHLWMLSVDSPSYSLHVSSFLTKMTVVSLTNPPPSILIQPMEISHPPFALKGSADRPFLAQITFTWVGDHNPPMVVQHWVELDLLKTGSTVLGDEQVLNVELDRNTELLPIVVHPPSRLSLSEMLSEIRQQMAPAERNTRGSEGESTPAYAVLLKSLLPKFPLTAKDFSGKGRVPSQVPYKLVSGPGALRALAPGRRKAIEWLRARALCEAYERIRLSSSPAKAYIPLSPADVFCWLDDEGHFLRPPPMKPAPAPKPGRQKKLGQLLSLFCGACGLDLALHSSYIKEESEAPGPLACPFSPVPHLPRIPMIDMDTVLRHRDTAVENRVPQDYRPLYASLASSMVISKPTARRWRWSKREVLMAADPKMVLGVMNVAGALGNAAFSGAAAIENLEHPDRVPNDAHLESSAILSLILRPFVRRLLAGGVEAMQADMRNARQSNSTPGILSLQGMRQHKSRMAVLSPSHIVRGLVDVSSIKSRGPRSKDGQVWSTTATLSALGVCYRNRQLSISMDTQHAQGVAVKQEEV